MGWLKRKEFVPTAAAFEHQPVKGQLHYPMWTFARLVNTDNYYLILEKTKMPFISERAFASWGKPYISVSEENISGYMKWKDIGFAPGTLIISEADGSKWYITGSDPLATERRLIATPEFYSKLGFDLDDAYMVSLPEVDHHKKGENIVGISL